MKQKKKGDVGKHTKLQAHTLTIKTVKNTKKNELINKAIIHHTHVYIMYSKSL